MNTNVYNLITYIILVINNVYNYITKTNHVVIHTLIMKFFCRHPGFLPLFRCLVSLLYVNKSDVVLSEVLRSLSLHPKCVTEETSPNHTSCVDTTTKDFSFEVTHTGTLSKTPVR